MRHGILAIALGGGLALSGVAAIPLHGQDAAGREPLAITVGLDWYEPANEQCTVTPGLTLGVEARTRGPWLLAAGGEALFTGGGLCTTALIGTTWEGRDAIVDPTGPFGPAYRVGARAGRAMGLGPRTVTVGLSAGLIGPLDPADGFTGRGPEPAWYGAFLRTRRSGSGWGLDVEVASLGFEIRYLDFETYEVVHRFQRRKPLIRATVVVPIGATEPDSVRAVPARVTERAH
ncbi:MAG: hypothetical protein R6U63_12390 [Longimicrobiales bacterium]